MNNDIGEPIPSDIDVIKENYKTMFSGEKTCPRCGTKMPAAAILCPNCSAYTAGTTVIPPGRLIGASARQVSKESNRRYAAGFFLEALFFAGVIGLFIGVGYLPKSLSLFGTAFACAAVAGLIYMIIYLLIVKLYMRQIPRTERLDHADQFSGNFRITDRQK